MGTVGFMVVPHGETRLQLLNTPLLQEGSHREHTRKGTPTAVLQQSRAKGGHSRQGCGPWQAAPMALTPPMTHGSTNRAQWVKKRRGHEVGKGMRRGLRES